MLSSAFRQNSTRRTLDNKMANEDVYSISSDACADKMPMCYSKQEGGVNTPDWADPMIIAIMTSRRKKRANAEKFRKWRRRPLSKQLFGASFSTHWSVKLCRFFVESCNYDLSLLRGKWNSEYSRKIMRKVYLKCFCPCPVLKIM